MCGPLVSLLRGHPHKNAYFLGRISGFTIMGLLAGEMGFILQSALKDFHLLALLSLMFSLVLFFQGLTYFTKLSLPRISLLSHALQKISMRLSSLMLKETFFPIFCFGLATLLLPCGQSLLVLSFSAVSGSALLGAINGLLFSLLTTPALFLSLQFFKKVKFVYPAATASILFFVATLFLLRGLADMDLIPHLILNSHYHIAIY